MTGALVPGARPLKVFVIAGEPSGDALGGRLMAALRAETGDAVTFCGIGGARMAEQGLDSLVPLEDLALFGLIEIIPQLPRLLRRLAETVRAIVAEAPDVVVTIDAPGFTFRVAARLRAAIASGRAAPVPLVHYVAPTVWAWRPERAAKMARLYDQLMALLPFEPPWFARVGLGCRFVGHPVIESGIADGDGARFRAAHGVGPDTRVLAVLPGSRGGEVRRLLPVFGRTLGLLAADPAIGPLLAAVPTVPHVADRVRSAVVNWPVPTVVVEGEAAKADAFAAADAALAASGTVALELALARVPAVIAYRVHPLTARLARRLIRVRFANLVNLMHDRAVVPELLQEACRPDTLAPALTCLLLDDTVRAAQCAAYGAVAAWLGEGATAPSARAAAVVLAAAGARPWPPDADPPPSPPDLLPPPAVALPEPAAATSSAPT